MGEAAGGDLPDRLPPVEELSAPFVNYLLE
jgi:hypothetical protein